MNTVSGRVFKDSEVLITGGLGFVGSSLAHGLVEAGAKVEILDASLEGLGANPANVEDIAERIDVVHGDVRDSALVKKAARGKKFVFHCAAQLNRLRSTTSPAEDIDINCIGTVNVLEAVRGLNGECRMVFTSSRAALGRPATLPANESTQGTNTEVYGVNKKAAEQYCMLYHRLYGVPVSIVRISNCYGPRGQMRNPNYLVANYFIGKAIRNEELTVFKPGNQIRDYNYITDVVEALLLAASSEKANGEIYMLGSEQPVRLIELANSIVRIAGSGKVKLVPWPDLWSGIDVGDFYAETRKIRNDLGWKPTMPLDEGLRLTIAYYSKMIDRYL
jgi:UDP-glucose 4-epimerase